MISNGAPYGAVSRPARAISSAFCHASPTRRRRLAHHTCRLRRVVAEAISARLAGEPVADAALALDQVVGLDAAQLAAHAMDELAHVLAIGLDRAERQRIGDLVPRHV